jgi:uncharacterized membrane protein
LERVIAADSFQAFPVIEGQVFIPIVFRRQADAKVGHSIPHRCKVKGFVV